MVAKFDSIGKAEAEFQKMVQFVKQASASGELRADEVEQGLFETALTIGKHLLKAFTEQAGDGDHGPRVQHQEQTLVRSETKKTKKYRSVFGVLEINRYVYAPGPKKLAVWKPVDAQLGLPAGEQSYVLEDWTQRFCIKDAFAEGVGSLRDLLGVKTSVRAAEVMNRSMAQHVDGFRAGVAAVDPESEAEIIVLAADGKGVPMRRPLADRLHEHKLAQAGHECGEVSAEKSREPHKKRLGRGEKRTRKQMAYVGAIYSIAPFVRSAEQIVDELRRRRRQEDRPRPQNKHLFAEMTRFREDEVLNGQEQCFVRLAWSAIHRAGKEKTLVCLMDGQRSLWNLKESWFPRAIGVLDIFHVLERLWQVAHAFHGEGFQASSQVTQHLQMLLEGKVGYVIGVYKRMLTTQRLKAAKATTVRETITYFENNRQYMQYDDYLAAGYPIGTGVVEGACRHYVKDRMELAGMRWEIEGAQAMLNLRALYLNDQWEDFIQYRIQTEQDTLYGQAA